jgi:hypothetical protein
MEFVMSRKLKNSFIILKIVAFLKKVYKMDQ